MQLYSMKKKNKPNQEDSIHIWSKQDIENVKPWKMSRKTTAHNKWPQWLMQKLENPFWWYIFMSFLQLDYLSTTFTCVQRCAHIYLDDDSKNLHNSLNFWLLYWNTIFWRSKKWMKIILSVERINYGLR